MLTQLYFYPRPPGGGRPFKMASFDCKSLFLSTPSGWRATIQAATAATLISLFLSTPSGWRATAQSFRKSIALRLYFYPRPPGGGRQRWTCVNLAQQALFLSTPSGWRATCCREYGIYVSGEFLSTPSGWRATPQSRYTCRGNQDFYPRPPGGGRQLEDCRKYLVN